MKRKRELLLTAVLALTTVFSGAFAGPDSFTYQGALKDAQGNKLTVKNHVIEFRLYNQAVGGVPCWGKRVPVLLDDDGLFAVELSATTNATELINGVPGSGLAAVFAENAGSSLYLGLTVVGSSGEIKPRQRLLSVPYASLASDSASASGIMTVSNTVIGADAKVTERLQANGINVTGAAELASAKVGGVISAKYGTIPIGGIITWSGAANTIPYGWALCNGQRSNGRQTPDLRNRFIVGAGSSYSVGNTGGVAMHTLSVGEMPRHDHGVTVKTVGVALRYNAKSEAITYDSNSQNNGNKDVASNNTGGGAPHENRPPFYALCYIMRVM